MGGRQETGLWGDEKDCEGLKGQEEKKCESQRVGQHVEGAQTPLLDNDE